MTAFTRSRIAALGAAVIATFAIVVACAVPPDSGDDDSCDADLQTDTLNCGECGRACVPGMFCQGGECTCTPPYQACGISCFNTQGDPNNCGGCGIVCPASAPFCSNRVCSTSCPLTTCPGNL